MAIEFMSIDGDEIEVQGARLKKDEVLLFKNVPVIKVEANKNRDRLSEQNAKDIAGSLALKPISLEHELGRMAGIFTEARYQAPYVVTDGLVYTKHVPASDIEDLKSGKKSLSIEARADKAICSVCGKKFDRESDYCNHLQARVIYDAYRDLEGCTGTGGGIVGKPAGSDTKIPADAVKFIASLAELDARDFSTEERKKMAEKGEAEEDGSYPIANVEDLHNAVRAWGRGGATAKDKAHIIKRAKALGAEKELPEDWVKGAEETGGKEKGKKKADGHTDEENEKEDKNETEKDEEQEDEMAKMHAKLKEAVAKAEAVPQMESKIAELTGEVNKLREQVRYQQLVKSGVVTEAEWAAKKDSIMKMDESGIELLASRQTQAKPRLVLGAQPPPAVVKTDGNEPPKRKLVFG